MEKCISRKTKFAILLAAILFVQSPFVAFAAQTDDSSITGTGTEGVSDSSQTDNTTDKNNQSETSEETGGDLGETDGTHTETDIYSDTITEPATGAEETTETKEGRSEGSQEESDQSNLGGAVTVQDGITMDGYFTDWDSYPASYEFPIDDSEKIWSQGIWIDGVLYKPEEGTYDTNVRHKMQIACDGTYVYLHIIFARRIESGVWGNGYYFQVGDEWTRFNLSYDRYNMSGLTLWVTPGVYDITVRHGKGELYGQIVSGAEAKLTVTENHQNNAIELKIPLSELHTQNSRIDAENIETISFYSPLLMTRKITATGTDTGTTVGVVLLVGAALLAASAYYRKRKVGH